MASRCLSISFGSIWGSLASGWGEGDLGLDFWPPIVEMADSTRERDPDRALTHVEERLSSATSSDVRRPRFSLRLSILAGSSLDVYWGWNDLGLCFLLPELACDAGGRNELLRLSKLA